MSLQVKQPFKYQLYTCKAVLICWSFPLSVIYSKVSSDWARGGAWSIPIRSFDLPGDVTATSLQKLSPGNRQTRLQSDGVSHRCVRGTSKVSAQVQLRAHFVSFLQVATKSRRTNSGEDMETPSPCVVVGQLEYLSLLCRHMLVLY